MGAKLSWLLRLTTPDPGARTCGARGDRFASRLSLLRRCRFMKRAGTFRLFFAVRMFIDGCTAVRFPMCRRIVPNRLRRPSRRRNSYIIRKLDRVLPVSVSGRRSSSAGGEITLELCGFFGLLQVIFGSDGDVGFEFQVRIQD